MSPQTQLLQIGLVQVKYVPCLDAVQQLLPGAVILVQRLCVLCRGGVLRRSTPAAHPQAEADGSYTPFDFTEYGWQDTPSYLAPWLADNWEGMKAAALSDNGWQTKTTVRESDRSAYFALWFYPGDETGGTVDLYWMYEDSDGFEEFWNGTWEIESVMEGPSYITFDLSLEWGKGDIDPANPPRIQETYPALISPSGNLLIGMGENGVCLPFMSQNTNTYILTWME